MRSRDFPIEERPLCDIAGVPDGHPIVFVHASGWTRKMWQPQMAALADEFRGVALDLPQHGQLAKAPFRLDTAVQGIADVIASTTCGRALVVGLSLGGYVAMTFADRYPERVAGLVLAGCSVGFDGLLGILTRISALTFSLYIRCANEPMLKRLATRQEHAIRCELPPDLARSQLAAGFTMDAWGRALLQIVNKDFRAMLRAFAGPVLILNGEHDTYNRKAELAQLHAAGNGQLRVIAGAGHITNLHCPDIFSQEVRAFAHTIAW